jgi:hypothetical protein
MNYHRIETTALRAIKVSAAIGQTVVLEADYAADDMSALAMAHDGEGLFWGIDQHGREWTVLVDA